MSGFIGQRPIQSHVIYINDNKMSRLGIFYPAPEADIRSNQFLLLHYDRGPWVSRC